MDERSQGHGADPVTNRSGESRKALTAFQPLPQHKERLENGHASACSPSLNTCAENVPARSEVLVQFVPHISDAPGTDGE